jgi:hypothetical protein
MTIIYNFSVNTFCRLLTITNNLCHPFEKGMVNLMLDSTTSMLRTWETRVENEGGVVDIKIDEDLRSLSADILSRACFGSDYAQGEEIFLKLETLQRIMSKTNVGIPGYRYDNISNSFTLITIRGKYTYPLQTNT